MAIDPPYRLDPLQNVVNVKWGALKYLTCALEINPSPTIAFQQQSLAVYNTDRDGLVPPPVSFPLITQFRWVWRSQAIRLTAPYTGPLFGGSWAAAADAVANPIGVWRLRLVEPTPSNPSPDPPVIWESTATEARIDSGDPGLPLTTGAAAGALSAIGSAPTSFWPQGLWDKPTGSNVSIDIGSLTSIPIESPDADDWGDGVQRSADNRYKSASSVTIRLRAWTMAETSLPGFGFVPEGGWVQLDQEPAQTFAPLTISGLRVSIKVSTVDEQGTHRTVWRPYRSIGASLSQTGAPGEEDGYVIGGPAYSRPAGRMWILLERE